MKLGKNRQMDHSSIMPDIMQLPEAPAASNSCHWALSKSDSWVETPNFLSA
ncbi:hypothetical protein [Eubacterium sp.]|uniref:hypothetical protein n=1 Tax=Eubacterium sp. TaxID=142586 RepID=UPI003AB63337